MYQVSKVYRLDLDDVETPYRRLIHAQLAAASMTA